MSSLREGRSGWDACSTQEAQLVERLSDQIQATLDPIVQDGPTAFSSIFPITPMLATTQFGKAKSHGSREPESASNTAAM